MHREEAGPRTWIQHGIGAFALFHVVLLLLVNVNESPFDEGPYGGPGRLWNRVYAQVDRVAGVYGQLLGPKQHWGMFGSVSDEGTSLHLRVVTPTERILVYRERSPTHDWHRFAFDHYRWREWMSELGKKRARLEDLQRFVDWAGPRLAAEHPEACEVVATIRVAAALDPDQLIAAEPHDYRRIRRRARYRVPGSPCPD